MKWTVFAILAVVFLVLQTTLGSAIAIQSIRPNWVFVLVVFYALWGPWPDAAIAAWLLGLGVDLLSTASGGGRIGLYAFCFGAAAWAMMQIRAAFFREHAVTQFVMTAVFAMLVEFLVEVFRWWTLRGAPMDRHIGGVAFFTALYTAAWAPYLHWMLLRLHRWTGLKPAHRL